MNLFLISVITLYFITLSNSLLINSDQNQSEKRIEKVYININWNGKKRSKIVFLEVEVKIWHLERIWIRWLSLWFCKEKLQLCWAKAKICATQTQNHASSWQTSFLPISKTKKIWILERFWIRWIFVWLCEVDI